MLRLFVNFPLVPYIPMIDQSGAQLHIAILLSRVPTTCISRAWLMLRGSVHEATDIVLFGSPSGSWISPTTQRFSCGELATMHCQPKQIFLNKSLLTTLFVPYVKWNQKLRLIYCEDAQLPNLSGACVVEGFRNGVLNMKTLCLLLLIYIAFWIWLRWHY